MTRLTFPILISAVTLLAGAAAARAEGIAVQVANRDPRAVRSDIVRAADRVCTSAVEHDWIGDYPSVDDCVDTAVDAALRQISHGVR